MSFDTYQAVTDEICAALDRGVVPWHRPWVAGEPPANLVSRKPYRGVNTLLLSLCETAETPWWLTFKQAGELGGRVRRGEHGRMVVFFKQLAVEDKDTGEERRIPLLRYYKVFNAGQCDGIEIPPREEIGELEGSPCERAEALIAGMPSPPSIGDGGDHAYYSPSMDHVQLPYREVFESHDAFYRVAFHELTHATGHKSRLGRFEQDASPSMFGSESYGREELVAELGAAFCANACGIDQVAPSASYIKSWLSTIRKDKKLIVSAASKATAAADYIRGI